MGFSHFSSKLTAIFPNTSQVTREGYIYGAAGGRHAGGKRVVCGVYAV
jgi:hypothetical protein